MMRVESAGDDALSDKVIRKTKQCTCLARVAGGTVLSTVSVAFHCVTAQSSMRGALVIPRS